MRWPNVEYSWDHVNWYVADTSTTDQELRARSHISFDHVVSVVQGLLDGKLYRSTDGCYWRLQR